MENLESKDMDNNLNKPRYNESSGTGVIGSLVFMGIMVAVMIILANIIH